MVQKWNMPNVPKERVYERNRLGFDFSSKDTKNTFSFEKVGTGFSLLRDAKVVKSLQRKCRNSATSGCYAHIAVVQIAVKPLTAYATNEESIQVTLNDARFVDYKTSLVGAVEFKLMDTPIYFNCYANMMVPLSDPKWFEYLVVKIKRKDGAATMAGLESFEVSYRFCYKVMSSPYGDKAVRESRLGETTLLQPVDSVVKRGIKWDDMDTQ